MTQAVEKKEQTNRRPGKVRVTQTVHSVEIKGDFQRKKTNPLVAHGWKIWKNHKDQLVAIYDQENAKQAHVFNFEEGTLYLVERPGNQYAYFRSIRFQKFMAAYGITKIRNVDPNGAYRGRSGVYKRNTDIALIVGSDEAQFKYVEDNELNDDDTHLENVILEFEYASCTHFVSDADFVIFDQTTVREPEDDIEGSPEVSFHTRCLVTHKDIFTIEKEIQEAISVLESRRNAALEE